MNSSKNFRQKDTMKTEIKIERTKELLRLSKGLRKVPRRNFDMSEWAAYGKFHGIPAGVELGRCGTTACAIGWLPTICPDTGIKLSRLEMINGYYHLEPEYENFFGFSAIEKYFGLDEEESHYLFANEIKTPTAVANRIERFAKERLCDLKRS